MGVEGSSEQSIYTLMADNIINVRLVNLLAESATRAPKMAAAFLC